MKKLLGIAICFLLVGPINAATYNITAVLNGGGGFGASLFHDASGATVQSGNIVGNIDNITGILGTYDDVTGAFNATLDVTAVGSPVPTTFTLSGTLFFDNAGLLDNNYSLFVDFLDGSFMELVDSNLGFKPGYVCCGNNGNDPNSLLVDGNGDLVMTLWGANFFSGLPFTGAYDNKTNLGMDLRIKLEPVPVPAAVWLFGSGLLGLVGVARRKA